jgi:putative transposase
MAQGTTLKAFVYRLYPTKTQTAELHNHLYLTRQLYNAALEERRTAYRRYRKTVTAYDQMKMLGEVKAALPEYKAVYAQVLQDTLKRLDKAFDGFFRRAKAGQVPGYPRFKSANRWRSFTFPQVWRSGKWTGPGKLLQSAKVYLPNIGNIRIKQHRPLEGTPKALTIKHVNGKWYAVYTCEVPMVVPPFTGAVVGLDLGLTSFVATSDGELIAAPQHLRKAERLIKRSQRTVSRRKRGSNRRCKAVRLLAKRHERVKNQRKDFHHKLSRKLVNENDLIAHEDLNVSGLARTRLAKSIHDAGWSAFIACLNAKAANAGRLVRAVSPHYTSQDCPQCGARVKKTLAQRWHSCPCGCELDRDVAAAQNILRRALDGGLGEQRPVAGL